MKTDIILEGNKLIAEFMGLSMISKEEITEDIDINKFCYQPRYHSDWNWLMPVVEKINDLDSLYHINIYSAVVTVFSYSPVETLCKFNNSDTSKIKAIWLAVLEFIKWFNTEKI